MDQVQRVPDGSTEPIEGVEDDRVAFAHVTKHRPEAWPLRGGPRALIETDPLARDAGHSQRLDLSLEFLLGRRDSRVAEAHVTDRCPKLWTQRNPGRDGETNF